MWETRPRGHVSIGTQRGSGNTLVAFSVQLSDHGSFVSVILLRVGDRQTQAHGE